ncbi:hypothetical protein OHB35_44370 [Streptomyces phaeochromogenes]|uniref:FMN-binding domain-containing protein n=1 Tax=Streptomyces phaeochromogenes TaxID=1923 RepID=A0ABZ1HM75_STRPH|nr:hypothetical protein [Streptomyces phaeochromogenes]WSD19710.1 hypothetical protein OHB35_44370 [Streptomyces phaeochromogenes]
MAALNRKIATAAMMGVSVTAALAGCSSSDDTDTKSSPPASSSSSATATGAPATPDGDYADGEYSADGEYGTQDSSIGVSLTLDNGVITEAEVKPHATNQTSRDFQERFADAAPELVVGQDIDDVDLDRVAGSSGTPDGFNDAVRKIKEEASQ